MHQAAQLQIKLRYQTAYRRIGCEHPLLHSFQHATRNPPQPPFVIFAERAFNTADSGGHLLEAGDVALAQPLQQPCFQHTPRTTQFIGIKRSSRRIVARTCRQIGEKQLALIGLLNATRALHCLIRKPQTHGLITLPGD